MDLPRRHIIRKLMPSYKALYRSKAGDKIVVTSLSPLPDKRKFKAVGGLRTFTKVRELPIQLQEVIIVAKSAKKGSKKKSVVDDELDELEGIDELDELEEELSDDDDEVEADEPEDETEDDDEDEDDEEEAPKKKKGSKSTETKRRPPSRAVKEGYVGTQEVAEFVGAKDARELRMVLRKLREKDPAFAPDSETGRYQWKSLKDKQVVKIKKAIEAGLHTQIKTEALDKLKASQAEKKAAKDKDATTKTKKGKKKNKKVSDDDE